MQFKYLIIPTVMMFQVAGAQTAASTPTQSQGTSSTPTAAASSTPVTTTDSPEIPGVPTSSQTLIMDYKSVYEASTLEEEVKMAAERFKLTPDQQEMWLTAAQDRRSVEKQAHEKLDSKAPSYDKDNAYRGLRTAQNTFHEIITGYLNPTQKQALETDRLILQEKQRRLAKLPPPPPPAPTVTVAPVDSAAIKEPAKGKGKGKKTAKKKKSAG